MTRLEKSWEAYKKNFAEWEAKGYAMDERLTKKEYRERYEEATSLGMKNIARTFAAEDRLVSASEASRLSKAVREAMKYEKTEDGEKVRKGFTVRRKIEEGEPGYVKGMKTYKTEKIDLAEFGIDPKDFTSKAIKARGLSQAYNDLREAGLSAREAGSIIDESYG